MNRTRSSLLIPVGLLVLLSACEGPFSTLDPAGPSADTIATLWWIMLAGATALFVMVLALFALVVRRPGWGSGLSPGRWNLLGGLALPTVVLLPLIGYALVAGDQLKPVAGNATMRVEVVARQWNWTFHYPDNGDLSTENVLHLPVGVPIDVYIRSEDVIHSFWVPQLAGKMDAIPGRENRLRVQVDAPGRYPGLCTEFCGVGHASMRFEVQAHPEETFAMVLAEAASVEEGANP